jgi:hypothetical protein
MVLLRGIQLQRGQAVARGLTYPADVRRWLAGGGILALDVDGNRESTDPGTFGRPGIGARAEGLLLQVFRSEESLRPAA